MEKVHILLVENSDDEIDFFSDALEESGLSFSCSIARNFDQAFNIIKNTLPDAVFINVNIVRQEQFSVIKKLTPAQNAPMIFYSKSLNTGMHSHFKKISYVQLPGSTATMARVLKNLLINNEIENATAAVI